METARSYGYAFQPIYDVETRTCISYEALIRGARGESAAQVFEGLEGESLYRLDRESRLVAIATAGRLELAGGLNLNVLPGGIEDPHSGIEILLTAGHQAGIAVDRITLEITESEAIKDPAGFSNAMDEYRAAGFKLAIDDFGAGYAGLNMLADFQPDVIKIDRNLVSGIRFSGPRQSIFRAISMVCKDLGIEVVAEGVETSHEFEWLFNEGVTLFQGFLFARPVFESLPPAVDPRGNHSRWVRKG